MEEEMTRDEMIKYEIDYYVNLIRIKNAEEGTNLYNTNRVESFNFGA